MRARRARCSAVSDAFTVDGDADGYADVGFGAPGYSNGQAGEGYLESIGRITGGSGMP